MRRPTVSLNMPNQRQRIWDQIRLLVMSVDMANPLLSNRGALPLRAAVPLLINGVRIWNLVSAERGVI